MGQITRSTSGMTNVSSATIQSLINTLRSRMEAGYDITASDVNQLIYAYNSFLNHNHLVTDLVGIDSYGNVSHYGAGGYYVSRYTNVVYGKSANGLTKASENDILTTDVNSTIASYNNIRSHYHQVYDATS